MEVRWRILLQAVLMSRYWLWGRSVKSVAMVPEVAKVDPFSVSGLALSSQGWVSGRQTPGNLLTLLMRANTSFMDYANFYMHARNAAEITPQCSA